MRNLLNKLLAAALLLGAVTVVASQQPNPPTKPEPAKDEKPAKSKLEQMLELALKNNPDLRVAEAKAREADAEVNRTRLAVSQKVVQLYNSIETARANVKLAEVQLDRIRALEQSKVVDRQVVDEAEAKLVQAKADLAKVEAEVPYLLGQPNVKVRPLGKDWELFLGKTIAEEDYRSATEKGIQWLREREQQQLFRTPDQYSDNTRLLLLALAQAGVPTVNKTMTERLHAALDKTLDFKQDGSSVKDVFAFLRDAKQFDIPVILKDGADQVPDTISFKAVTVGALLQWLEDSLPDHRFVVRDYGLVLMKRDKIPPGALLLDDFRKIQEKDTSKAKEEKK